MDDPKSFRVWTRKWVARTELLPWEEAKKKVYALVTEENCDAIAIPANTNANDYEWDYEDEDEDEDDAEDDEGSEGNDEEPTFN